MSMYTHLRALWKQPKKNLGVEYTNRLLKWRRESATVRVEKPIRLDRARALGYKAKQGYVVVRQRVKRGGRMRQKIRSGRRSKHMRRRKIVGKNYQWIAEERTNRVYTNCEVLNSYFVGKDKDYYYYEIILVDTSHPVIKKDLPWIRTISGRVYRGLTSAGKKSRGLMNKGVGAEKIR
ncbi:50S ribosomal protein L15e [Candidatus Woesearchaeota archaeon]|nr:50S ribosomal protein L15e [Candidatus Woesearchaeota archaeon]